jgi:uncharacterized BrkB/YihY/UPF0761 family membrane protein
MTILWVYVIISSLMCIFTFFNWSDNGWINKFIKTILGLLFVTGSFLWLFHFFPNIGD